MAEAALRTAAADTEEALASTGTFASLRLRNFRLLLLGTTLSNFAMWLQQVTMTWLVYDITNSGAMIGFVNLARSMATMGFAPVSGVLIDAIHRRTLMMMTALWMLVISGVLGVVLASGHQALWYLFLFSFLGGVAQAVDIPLRQTAVFVLVPRALASNAVALIQTGWGLMRSLGPALGGFLILWFGAGGNFLIQAAAYGLIMLNTLQLVFPPQPAAAGPRQGMVRNMAEGLRYVRREPETRAFLLMGWVLPLLIIPTYIALPPIFAKEVYGGGADTLGLLLAAVGVGGIFGGLVSASLGRVDRRGLVQLGALALLAMSLIGFALTTAFVLALALFAASGFFEMIFLTSNQTLLQLSIPDELRGRVTSLVTLNMGLAPLGALYAGAAADWLGPEPVAIVLSAGALAVAIGAALFSPTIRDYRISARIEAAASSP